MYKLFKRFMDIILSIIATVILLPIFLIIIIMVKIDSKGPVIFIQERLGKDKKPFKIYKFRTMKITAPKKTPTNKLNNIKEHVTKTGKFLRKTSLDELPQLINILKGDMSFIGPRPVLINETELINERDKYKANNIKPGLTGYAQVNGRDRLNYIQRAKLDGEYIEKMSLIFDIKIFLKTILVVINKDGFIEGENMDVNKLINRKEIKLDNKEISNSLKQEIILITGGGGSIGSELSRQILKYNPKELIIFDIYENNAYEIELELLRKKYKNNNIKTKITAIVGSVYNKLSLREVFNKYNPSIVFHAAAYKHVPMMELNPKEAIRTNVIGTAYVAQLSVEFNVKKMVLVSTDKAVRSTNVMGATKRFAELIINYYNTKGITIFSAVRFGNVLASSGSVVPLFKKQIEDGGPVTVTHKDITRYFMTISEAVGLILQCAVYAKGGEIFILDMGEPIKIYDLAVKMIKLRGYRPNIDINIEIVGLRPGEKLYEELLINPNNNYTKTKNKKIYIEKETPIKKEQLKLKYVIDNFELQNNDELKVILSKIIKTYKIDGDNNANT